MHFFKYVAGASLSDSWGIQVLASGADEVAQGAPYPVVQLRGQDMSWKSGRVLDQFAFVYISKGRGTFEVERDRPQEVRAGDLFFLQPERWHRYRPDTQTGWCEHWVVFDGEYVQQLFEAGELPQEMLLSNKGPDPHLVQLTRGIVDITEQEPSDFQTRLCLLVLELLLVCKRHTWQQGAPVDDEIVTRFKRELQSRLHEDADIPTMVSKWKVSYSWLRKRFKEHTGLAPQQYYIELKINKAKELLMTTRDSVQQIADQLAFQSPFYFSRCFKKLVRLSPRQFRNRQQGY